MKISFNKYSYYDPNDNNPVPTGNSINKYKFDNNHFNQLIANRQYQDAADYASKFHFNDVETQRAHENDILNLRREGRKLSALYSKIDNSNTLDKITFFDHVFVDGGLEQIVDNKYAQKFNELKQRLGSSHKSIFGKQDSIDREATTLSFTFAPEKQKFLGIDFLAKDNTERSIETFYKNSGLNETQLKSAGVEISHKDGFTTIKFDKSNKYANQIIYNIIPNYGGGDIGGKSRHNIKIRGYAADGTELDNNYDNKYIKDIRNLISESESAKLKAFEQIDAGEKNYSSMVGPALDDNLEYLNQLAASGQISQEDYNKQLKLNGSILDQAIRSLGSGNYEMFSNAYNEESTDETLVSLDNIQRSELMQSISAADPKNLHFNAMISNGQIGTLVTIDADEVDNVKINDGKDINKVKRRKRQVFIPGFMSELVQEKINRNTSTRAIQEINDMQDYGYPFKTTDGQEIYSSMDGRFYIDGNEIPKEVAENAINKTMIIEDAINNLKYEYTNINGQLFDVNGYEQAARNLAVRAANELNPNVQFEENITSVDDIFNKKGAGPTLSEDYIYGTQYQLYDKYQTVFEIYDKIMSAIINRN